MPTCRMCLADRKLIQAHVIPRAFYGEPDPLGPGKLISNTPGVFPKKLPIGVYDPHILCEQCDGQLGVLDQYAAENLLRATGEKMTVSDGETTANVHKYDGGDGERIARFAASVAWRASISRHFFFRRIKLGPYEESIRESLRTGEPLPRVVAVVAAEFNEKHVPHLDPYCIRMSGVRFWIFAMSRFLFYVKVDAQPTPHPFDQMTLGEGRHVITVERDWMQSKERAAMVGLAKANPGAFPLLRKQEPDRNG